MKKFLIIIVTLLALDTLVLPVLAQSNGRHLSGSYPDISQTASVLKSGNTQKPVSAEYEIPQISKAALSQQDHNDLYESLLILSTGWDQYHVNRANSILSNTNYSTNDWVEFFKDFFSNNPFTENLRNYLVYPVFWWFGDDVHLKLQLGLLPAVKNNITSIIGNHHESLGTVLFSDYNLRETLFSSLRILNEMARVGVINQTTRREIADFYSNLVRSYPILLLKIVSVDTETQPYVGAVCAQLYMNIGDTLPLDKSRKDEIALTLNVTDIYLQIWNNHSVLVIDNNGLTINQLSTIDMYLSSLPVGLHNLRYITVNSFLGNEDGKYIWFSNTAGINIFDIAVGEGGENGFPDDVDHKYSDLFSLVLAHEVNHIVDHYLSNKNMAWADRKQNLINVAGDNHMNYLRSIFEDGFFTNAPQEFFASIANQYFSDSAHTLELGLVRWQTGYLEPINQFLFFCDTYSQGNNTTSFYSIDEYGVLHKTMTPVYRDSRGHINRIDVNGASYQFILDEDGNVIGISTFPLQRQKTYIPLILND